MTLRLADLESEQSRRQHGRERILERAGWLAIGSLLLVACFGGLGPGMLTSRRAQSADGLVEMRYHAVERAKSPAQIELWLTAHPPGEGPVQLSVSQRLADAVQIEQIVPQPDRTIRDGDRMLLAFHRGALPPPAKIQCRFRFEEAGLVRYEVGIAGAAPIRIQQVVLP
jgi:hypothetical protein